VLRGLERAERTWNLFGVDHLCDAQYGRLLEMAELAVDFRERGVVDSIWPVRKRLSSKEARGRFPLYSAAEFQHHDSCGEGS